jgi:hypothetical protein
MKYQLVRDVVPPCGHGLPENRQQRGDVSRFLRLLVGEFGVTL